MDTIFNIATFVLFTVLGCGVSIAKKLPLLAVYSGDDGKLLLDLPDSGPVLADRGSEIEPISTGESDSGSDSQIRINKDEA